MKRKLFARHSLFPNMNLSDYTYFLVRQIPAGRVSTYGAVAKALGNKGYARAVGKYMNKNPDADTMPCFKIVKSDGSLGGFGLGINDKIRRLKKDGIEVKDGKIVNFENVFFNDFKTEYPLKKNKS
ncbi:MAG: MGMT family protein [Euryarchaeota archaeon]|nr:MGMT family protein [Euryarchaeota archaeon]